jgi:Phage protein (N4 Gp49/phage Sf6 gene 66) family
MMLPSEGLKASEAECAAHATAPRVSLDSIVANIESAHYRSAADAMGVPQHQDLRLLTLCIVVLRNGFTVVGKSAPAHGLNYNYDLGCKLALDDAIRQIWPLMGFALRDRIANGPGGERG